jgi:hypothetical protein
LKILDRNFDIRRDDPMGATTTLPVSQAELWIVSLTVRQRTRKELIKVILSTKYHYASELFWLPWQER